MLKIKSNTQRVVEIQKMLAQQMAETARLRADLDFVSMMADVDIEQEEQSDEQTF